MKKRKIIFGFLMAAGALSTVAPLASCSFGNHEVVAQEFTVTFDVNGGSAVASQTVKEGEKATKPADPTKDQKAFIGWYADANYTTEFSFDTEIKADTTVYAKWADKEYETVTYQLLHTDFKAGTAAADMVIGNFTIKKDAVMRSRTKTWTDPAGVEASKEFLTSLKLDKKGTLQVTVPGDGTLTVYVQNGSSSATTKKFYVGEVVDGIIGTEYVEYEISGTEPVKDASGNVIYVGGSPVCKVDIPVKAGQNLAIALESAGGTIDLYEASLSCQVEKADVSGFAIAASGTVDYVPGDTYSTTGLAINKVYGNGRTEAIELTDPKLKIDSSAVDFTKPGEYEVSVKYDNYDAQKIKVVVYKVDSISLGFNKTELLSKNSAAGNGVYFNQTVQRVYKTTDTAVETKDLTVIAKTSHPTDTTKTKEFILAATDYTIDGFNSEAGKKEITVTYGDKTAKFDVYVVDTAPSVVNDTIQISVDQAYTGTVGAVVDGFNTFTSVQQALDYLNNIDYNAEGSTITNNTKKLIKLAAGTYKEKVEITLPNVTIEGAGADTTMIEWNSLYGIADEGGFNQVTDSTQTLAVRDTAVNCTIKNITVSNYYHSLENFDAVYGAGYAEHRALAILIMGDQFKMDGCKLLGYQDTIELFYGRQYITNTYIQGTTDFIFGTNNTTYFYNCEIKSITGEANRGDKTDGGYITAFKGLNKSTNDAVLYGAIFDHCNFTADEEVAKDGNVAVGRTWGQCAAVMIMNSTIGGHVTTTANDTGTKTKNVRIVCMNAINVKDSVTLKFTEYNNTGDGAITESQNGVKVLTAEEAADYSNFAKIFGTTNGKVAYDNVWDPTSTTVQQDMNTYYLFNATEKSTGTVVKYTTSVAGDATDRVITANGLTVDATNGNVNYRESNGDTIMNAGVKIKFSVKAGSVVAIDMYDGRGYYTINGTNVSSGTFSKYFAEDTDVEITVGEQLFMHSIIVKPDQEAQAPATVEEIIVSNPNKKVTLGTDYSLGENCVVTANYTDGSFHTLTAEEVAAALNASAVNKDVAGTYEIVVTFGGVEKKFNVEYAASFDSTLHRSYGVTFKGSHYTKFNTNIKNVAGLEAAVDATSADVDLDNIIIHAAKSNGSATNWLQFNTSEEATASITINVDRACTLEVGLYAMNKTVPAELIEVKYGTEVVTTTDVCNADHSGNLIKYEIAGAGTITITAVSNDYLGFVGVVMDNTIEELATDAKAELEAAYPAANYSKNTEAYNTALTAAKALIDTAEAAEGVTNQAAVDAKYAEAVEAMNAVEDNAAIDAKTIASIVSATTSITQVEKDSTPVFGDLVVVAAYADSTEETPHTVTLEADKYTVTVDTSTIAEEVAVTVTLVENTSITKTFNVAVVAAVPKYDVTYDVQGHGTAPAVANVSSISLPEMADLDDYKFAGWYTEATCENAAVANTAVTEAITLYAKWISLADYKTATKAAAANTYKASDYTEYPTEYAAAIAAYNAAVDAEGVDTIAKVEAVDLASNFTDIKSDAVVKAAQTIYSFVGADEAASNVIKYAGTNPENLTITCATALEVHGTDSYKIKSDTTFTVHVTEASVVIIEGYKSHSTIVIDGRTVKDGIRVNAAADSDVTFTMAPMGGDNYIKRIIVSPLSKEVPAVTATSLSIKGAPNSEISVGTAADLSKLEVNVVNSDGSYYTSKGYSTDIDEVNISTAGVKVVTVTDSYTGLTATFNLTYVEDVETAVVATTTWSFNDDTTNASATYKVWDSTSLTTWDKLTFSKTASDGIADNGGYLSFKKVGSIISFDAKTGVGKLAISVYNDEALTVRLNGKAVTGVKNETTSAANAYIYEYDIFGAGKVEIEATANQNYLNNIKYTVIQGAVDKTTTWSFNDDTTNASSTYKVWDSTSLTTWDKLAFSKTASDGIADNGGYLSFKKVGSIITLYSANTGVSKLAISVYNDEALTVRLNGKAVTGVKNATVSAKNAYVYEYILTSAGKIEIEATANQNYLNNIKLECYKIIDDTKRIAFGSDNRTDYLSDVNTIVTGTASDNGGNNTKFYGGYIVFRVASGAKVDIFGNYSVDYIVNGTAVKGKTSDSADNKNHIINATEDTTIVIQCDPDTSGDNYFYWIDVTFPTE